MHGMKRFSCETRGRHKDTLFCHIHGNREKEGIDRIEIPDSAKDVSVTPNAAGRVVSIKGAVPEDMRCRVKEDPHGYKLYTCDE